MTRRIRSYTGLFLSLALAGMGSMAIGNAAQAQDQGGYSISEQDNDNNGNPDNSQATQTTNASQTNSGPVRLARFSYLSGNVTWRPDDQTGWATGSVNQPLREGAQIWISGRGRAEIQFDDGSYLRMGSNAIVTLQTLYSDADGEFTELKMTQGLAFLSLKHEDSLYQIDTPLVSVKAAGPARIRIGTADGVEIGVRDGKAAIEGPQGKTTMQAGDYLDLADAEAPYDLSKLPRPDSFELWNDDRDQTLSNESAHLPANIAQVAGDLD